MNELSIITNTPTYISYFNFFSYFSKHPAIMRLVAVLAILMMMIVVADGRRRSRIRSTKKPSHSKLTVNSEI